MEFLESRYLMLTDSQSALHVILEQPTPVHCTSLETLLALTTAHVALQHPVCPQHMVALQHPGAIGKSQTLTGKFNHNQNSELFMLREHSAGILRNSASKLIFPRFHEFFHLAES